MELPDQILNNFGWRSTLSLMAVLVLSPLIVIVISMNRPWQATFSINAQTEIAEFETGQQNIPNWFVMTERIRIDGMDADPFSGQLKIGRETRVRLVRLHNGPLRLTVVQAGQGPAAILFDEAENRIATARERLQAIVAVPRGKATTLPITGRAVIGDTIFSQSVETSPVLLDGHVQVFGRYVIGRNRFAAQQAQLDSGDRLELDYSSAAPSGNGLIRIQPDQPGVKVVFHADADAVRILRFGTAGYELSPSLWARVSADPLYQSLLAIYAVLLPAIGLALASLLNQFRLRQMAKRNCGTATAEASALDRENNPDTSNTRPHDSWKRRMNDLESSSQHEAEYPSARGASKGKNDADT